LNAFVFEFGHSEDENKTSKKKNAYSRIPDDSKPSLKDYEHRKEVKLCLFFPPHFVPNTQNKTNFFEVFPSTEISNFSKVNQSSF
jgi:hypothetical protein